MVSRLPTASSFMVSEKVVKTSKVDIRRSHSGNNATSTGEADIT